MELDRLTAFLSSLEPDYDPFLADIQNWAIQKGVPIVRRETASLLQTLIALKQPGTILEVGTAIGFSSLLMSQVMPAQATIVTLEKYEPYIEKARENIRRAGKEAEIVLIAGDAAATLGKLQGPFDFVFMDAAKGQYLHFLPDVLRLLKVGGVLVSDNVLQEGDVLESRFAIPRRNRTIHSRMRDYLFVLKHREDLQTAILPIGDGVTVSVKRARDEKKEVES